MTVQEFYDWCKARKITDAEMEISLKFAGLDMSGVTENLPDTNVGNNEYISKQAALECVTYDEEYTTEQIKSLPAADVAPVVHGRWVKEYWHGEKTRRCSVCNITQTVNVYKDDIKFKYCPYCGAKMDA